MKPTEQRISDLAWKAKMPTEPYDGPLRFLIPSKTESGVSYLVDLSGYDGAGVCQCRYWECVCAPDIKQGKVRRCQHIIMAREIFTDWIIKKLAAKDRNKE